MTTNDRPAEETDADYEAWRAMAEREAYALLFPPRPGNADRGMTLTGDRIPR